MRLIFAMCLVPFVACTAETPQSPIGWSDWVSEGKVLTRAGNYSAATQAFRRALSAAERANVGEQRLVEIHDALASAYAEAGQYAESEYEYRRTLALAEKAYGRPSLEYALLVASMAVLPTQIGNRDAAAALLRQGIALNRRSGTARDLAIVRGCLAHILIDRRKYSEAESVLLDAKADFASLRKTDPKALAELLSDLGLLRFNQRRFDESVEPYQESLRLFQFAMGAEHPSQIVLFSNLALSYLKTARFTEAELVLQHAIDLCSRTLGKDHPTYGVLLENYTAVLSKLGRKREANAAAARSREILRAWRTRNGVGLTISITALHSDKN